MQNYSINMTDEKNIIDLGSVTVPTSWNDITLKTFQEIERYYADTDKNFNVIDVLDILIDKDRDYIMSLPEEFLTHILEKLQFLQTKPEEKEPRNWVEIKGERYTVNTQNKLKVGEYVAADTAMKADKYNYAAILAILCRKDGEVYNSKYENEVLEDRIKMFEDIPIMDVLPIVSFFLNLWLASQIPSRLSSTIREGIDLTRSNIESSARNGEISKRCMKSLTKKLTKLEKYLDSI